MLVKKNKNVTYIYIYFISEIFQILKIMSLIIHIQKNLLNILYRSSISANISAACMIVYTYIKLVLVQATNTELLATNVLLIEKHKNCKVTLSELLEQNAVVTKSIECNNTLIISVTILTILGIFLFYYYGTTGPIICPVRVITQSDRSGNEIQVGIPYPVTADGEASAAIRFAGTADFVSLDPLVSVVLNTPGFQPSMLPALIPRPLTNTQEFLKSLNSTISNLLDYFI